MKKIVCLIFAVLMLMSFLSVNTFAENNINYDLKDGVLTVSGEGVIPKKTFEGRTDFHTVIIKAGITGIGDAAFKKCVNIKTVSLPNTLKKIEGAAFDTCYNLNKINIPNSVESIGGCAFYNCAVLPEIKIPFSVSTIGMLAFGLCKNLTITLYRTEKTEIGFIAFDTVPRLIVKVPEGWSGDQSLFYAQSGEYITDTGESDIETSLENGVLTITGRGAIQDEAFYRCNDFHTLVIGEGITAIGNEAFHQCDELKTVLLPSTLESIGKNAFSRCSVLEEISIPNSVNTIEEYAFNYCRSLPEIEIPDTVSTINKYAFAICDNLTATLHRTAQTIIGYEAFKSIPKLIVKVPEGWSGDCQESFGANSVEYINENNSTASTLSSGNIWIVAAIGAVAVIGIAAVVISKKKKKETADEKI